MAKVELEGVFSEVCEILRRFLASSQIRLLHSDQVLAKQEMMK